jgi:tight adherence protein C
MFAVGIGAAAALAALIGITVLGRLAPDRKDVVRERAARRLRELGGGVPAPDAGVRFLDLLSRLGSWLASGSMTGVDELATQLARAGYRHPSAVRYFSGFRVLLTLALGVALSAAAGASHASPPRVLMWGLVGGVGGYLVPAFVLASRVKARQKVLRNALPDALDILVLSVEGGVSLNAAVSCVTDEIQAAHPPLGAELLVVQREMQLGLSAGEAFRGLADRCDLAEVRDLAAALIQSERYGASAAKTLRSYADSARTERQLWAEEVAQKAAVKIIFPMLLCIFPAMFIVLLGPAAFQMSRLFNH